MRPPPTTFRFTDQDRAVIDRLREMTGLDSAAAAIRLAVREAVALREGKFAAPKGGK